MMVFLHSVGICANACVFFFNDTATTEIYTLSLHDALPISQEVRSGSCYVPRSHRGRSRSYLQRGNHWTLHRSEEHTSELQSPCNLVCRLLLEKKKRNIAATIFYTCRTKSYSVATCD